MVQMFRPFFDEMAPNDDEGSLTIRVPGSAQPFMYSIAGWMGSWLMYAHLDQEKVKEHREESS